jgi:hypothetical protein
MALLYDFSEATLEFVREFVSPWLVKNGIDPSRTPWMSTLCIDGNTITGFQFHEPRVVERHTGTYAKVVFTAPLLTPPPPEFVSFLRTADKR